jgi:hypothetical protein
MYEKMHEKLPPKTRSGSGDALLGSKVLSVSIQHMTHNVSEATQVDVEGALIFVLPTNVKVRLVLLS